MSTFHDVRAVETTVEVAIDAPRERVWEALTSRASDWWHKDYYTGAAPRGFVFEAKLGGRVYEDWGEGEGAVWYTVVGLKRGESLSMEGTTVCGPKGLETIFDRVTLSDRPGGTLLRMESRAMGIIGDDFGLLTEKGWTLLFGTCLKNYVERGVAPDVPATVRRRG